MLVFPKILRTYEMNDPYQPFLCHLSPSSPVHYLHSLLIAYISLKVTHTMRTITYKLFSVRAVSVPQFHQE